MLKHDDCELVYEPLVAEFGSLVPLRFATRENLVKDAWTVDLTGGKE